jgi:hypothetical protein
MADQGFIVNAAEVTSIGTSYAIGKIVTLNANDDIDDKSTAMPSGSYLSHLELQLDETSSTVANVSCFLTWDAAGDDPITAEASEIALHAGMTDTSLRNTSISMDVWAGSPTGQAVTGTCYLFLKVNAGAVTLKKARLYWVVR